MSELRTHEDVERDVLQRVRIQVNLAMMRLLKNYKVYRRVSNGSLIEVDAFKDFQNEILKRLKEMEEGK